MPEKITITLTLELLVADGEDKAYYLSSSTNDVSPSCIADVFDNAEDMVGTLLTVNGYSKEQIKSLLNAELGI